MSSISYPIPEQNTRSLVTGLLKRKEFFLGLLLLAGLLAFEIFNYSTTQFALSDILGEMQTFGLRWATLLAFAFCGIDFAGVARLFSPEQSSEPRSESLYLFGAWLLAATMNAILTWWGVGISLATHAVTSTAIIDQSLLYSAVPVIIAIMVWVSRLLLITAFVGAGKKLFKPAPTAQPTRRPGQQQRPAPSLPVYEPVIKTTEPTYHPPVH